MNKRKKHLKRQTAVIFNAKKREEKWLRPWQLKTEESIRILAGANIKILEEILTMRHRINLSEKIAQKEQGSTQDLLIGFIIGVACTFLSVIILLVGV